MNDNKATVEMIEILPEKKRSGIMGKVISSVAFFIGVVICIAFIFDSVSAEGMADNIRDTCYDIMEEHFSNYQQYRTTIDSIMDECPYVTCNQYTIGSNTWYYMDFYNTENWGCMFSTSNSSWYGQLAREGLAFQVNNQYCTAWGVTDQYYEYDKNIKVYHMASRNNQFYFINTPQPSLDVRYSVLQYGHWLVGNIGQNSNISTVAGTYSNEYTNNSVTHVSTLLDYGHIYVQTARNYGGFRYLEDTIQPITNNTPGFECYKLDTKGGIYFYADYSNLITFDYGTSNTSIFSCDVHLDDTIQSISLDSTSEYYQYDVSYREAYYSFPITAFVPNYTDYENVWIDNVKVVNTYSGHGSSYDSTFVYITPVVIQGDAYNDGDLVNPDDVVIPDTDYQPISNVEIAENTYLVEFSNKDGLTFTEFHNVVIPNIYEDNTAWVYMDKSTYSFDDFIEDFLQGSGFDNLVDYITGIHSEDEAIEKMTDYLYDNAFTLTSDMVIFVYIDGDWKDSNFTSDDLTYWVYYTASGRLRAISQLLNSTNTNISRQLSISSGYFNYAKSKLNTIDKNLYEFANSQIGFNNAFVSKLNNIDTILGRIEALLKKILDALGDLHLEQLDSIDTKLSTIISNQGNGGGGSLNNDWYNGFREWLYNTDLTDDYLSPHEFFDSNFANITAFYDIFSKDDFYMPYIIEILDAFKGGSDSGTVDSNLIKYIKTGVDDESFNINDNDLYTIGGGT